MRAYAAIGSIVLYVLARPAFAAPQEEPRILSEAALDINNDGKKDRALLVDSPDGTNLHIYLDAGEGKIGLAKKPDFSKNDAAFYSYGSTNVPGLAVKGNSLIIETGKEISRYQWSERLTIVHRGGAFIVAGLTFSEEDVDEEKKLGSCDVNFLSGKALRNGKPTREKVAPVTLADWSDKTRPKACDFSSKDAK